SSVRFENGSTKSTHDCLPRFPIKWNITKPSRSLYVSHACSTPTSRTCPSHRLGPPHLPRLVYQKTEANHFRYINTSFQKFQRRLCLGEYLIPGWHGIYASEI
ncbi:unnamed protein product, partial [Prunus brigantina]